MEEDLVDLVIPALRWIVRRPKEDDDITRKKWWGKVRGKTGTVGFDSDALSSSADRICLSFPLFFYSERSNFCSSPHTSLLSRAPSLSLSSTDMVGAAPVLVVVRLIRLQLISGRRCKKTSAGGNGWADADSVLKIINAPGCRCGRLFGLGRVTEVESRRRRQACQYKATVFHYSNPECSSRLCR